MIQVIKLLQDIVEIKKPYNSRDLVLVAEAGLEPATSWLWATRAAAAPLRVKYSNYNNKQRLFCQLIVSVGLQSRDIVFIFSGLVDLV